MTSVASAWVTDNCALWRLEGVVFAAGAGTLSSHINLNVLDLDYGYTEFNPGRIPRLNPFFRIPGRLGLNLRPEEEPHGAWLCASCRRVFSVKFVGLQLPAKAEVTGPPPLCRQDASRARNSSAA